MGNISVNIQKENKLEAINNLSKAILEVAKALTTPTQVFIEGCHVSDINVSTNDGDDREIIEHETE